MQIPEHRTCTRCHKYKRRDQFSLTTDGCMTSTRIFCDVCKEHGRADIRGLPEANWKLEEIYGIPQFPNDSVIHVDPPVQKYRVTFAGDMPELIGYRLGTEEEVVEYIKGILDVKHRMKVRLGHVSRFILSGGGYTNYLPVTCRG